ncbi:MAG: PHP domain-containing protein [Gemmatimonadaceae bacterium]
MIGAAREPARRIDLHLHSTASDGLLSPTALVAAAHEAQVAVLALTDHDSVGGIAEARTAAGRHSVRVIAGVELSAHADAREVHLLGLHLERLDTLHDSLAELARARRERLEEIVKRLNDVGVRLALQHVEELVAGAAALGRPHVARALVAHGWAQDHRDAFERYLQPGKPGFVEKRRLPVSDAIALIHGAGGIAVLAHPAREDSLERLRDYTRAGLDGVEVAHPSLNADERLRLRAAASELGLVMSGGSDWHGAPEAGRRIGAEDIPAEWLDAQERRAALRRALTRVA